MRKVLGNIGYVLFCTLTLSIGTAMAVFERNPILWAGIQASGFYPTFLKPEPFKGMDELFILVLGCDENRYYARPGSKKPGQVLDTFARTDTIQLIRMDFKNKNVGMMQIPRDTGVDIPGYAPGKINGLFAVGGKEATASAVMQLTGIRPDRIVVLNYAAIKKMIDEVGGVEVYVPKRMYHQDKRGDLDIDLQPGRQLLDGKTALGYMRYRNDSDFYRGKRQQEFMVAFKEKVMSKGLGMGAVFRLSNLAMKIVVGGLTADEFVAIGKFAQQVPPARIKHGMLPVVEKSGKTQLGFDESKLTQALEESGLKDKPLPPATTHAISRQ